MIRIAIDAMGGDKAPQSVIEGVKLALTTYENIEIILFGKQNQLSPLVNKHPRMTIVDAQEIIEGEDDPVRAIRQKKESSMVKAAQAVKEGQADVLLSAGNTGALLTAGLLIVGRIKNIDRPGLMPIIPTISQESPQFILMDAGANADTKAINLHQFAILANFYAKNVLGIPQPRLGLINNGTEESKGNQVTKEAYQLIKADQSLNFVGNIEAKILLKGEIDIAITDGFTGNAILKTLEGTAKSVGELLVSTLKNSNLKTKFGGLLIKDALKSAFVNLDDTQHGGAVLLGVKAPVIKAHGSSNGQAIFSAIRQAKNVVESEAVEQIRNYFQTIN